MNTRAPDYTRTGNSWLASLANKLTYFGPIGGGAVASVLLMVDAGLSAVGWVFRGKFASAATALGSGTVSSIGAAATSMPIFWAGNIVSRVTTGQTINTHARALSESATSFVTKPLGMQPTVLRSHYAGIGGTGAAPATPGRFASQIANERGQNAQDMYNNYMRGEGGVHVNQLQSAQGRSA